MNLGASLMFASGGQTLKDFKPATGMVNHGHLTQSESKEQRKLNLLAMMAKPMNSTQLAKLMNMSQPSISTYLTELEQAGKVKRGMAVPLLWWKI